MVAPRVAQGEGKVEFHSFGLVPAPKCWECQSVMAPTNDIYWACQNPKCSEQGAQKHTGVYPLRETTRE